MSQEGYPDRHPEIRDHLLRIEVAGETREYIARPVWETAAAQRDDYRRVLALISAWRLQSDTRDASLDRLLESVDETYRSARATAGLIEEFSGKREQ